MKNLTKSFAQNSFVFFAFSLFVLPIYLNSTKNLVAEFFREAQKIPNNYSLVYEIKTGFSSNLQDPVVIEFQTKKIHFVVDPFSKFDEMEKEVDYLILRKKGVLYYKGSEFISNTSIELSDNLKISKIEILEFAKSLLTFVQTYYYAIFLLFGIYIQSMLDFLFVALFFALIIFLIFKSQKNKLTYTESLIKIVNLSKFFVIGKGLDIVFGQNIFATLVFIVSVGFMIYSGQKIKTQKLKVKSTR